MIGGRVLDATAVDAFVRQRSIYASALVWTATEEDIVLVVPASAVVEVRAGADEGAGEVLDVLLGLPVTVVEPLDAERARQAADLLGVLGTGRIGAAHAAATALARGWPLVSAEPSGYDGVPGLVVEEIP